MDQEIGPNPDDDWYWEQVRKIGIGPRYHSIVPDRIKIKKELDAYLNSNEMQKGRGLFIAGAVGTGKTSILSYIAVTLTVRSHIDFMLGFPENKNNWKSLVHRKVKFITATSLFNLFFNRNEPGARSKLNTLANIYNLMIDDLGREYRSDFPTTRFEELIERRYANKLPTFITSNITPTRLEEMNEFIRIVDRFKDSKWMRMFIIAGSSQRK